MIGSLLTLLPVALISRYRHQRDWRTLLLQGAALTAAALLQSLPWLWHGKESWNALLLTLTGGLTLAPICLVFWHYLANNTWLPLGRHWFLSPSTGAGGIWSGTCCCLLSVSGSSWIAGRTVALYAILSGAADYRAGLALWLARSADCDVDERHRADRQSNLARSSGGFITLVAGAKSDRLLLGAGIQRLRELNQSLQKELARNQHLAERLLETEESVRRDVARELHDDIGQTITAIRTQAGIVQRLAADNASVKQSGQLIEQLSLGVYDAVRVC